jgi:predicted transcriptional regulator
MTNTPSPSLREMTAGIVCGYVQRHRIAVSELPALIERIYQCLTELDGAVAVPVEAASAKSLTAAQIRKSIKPDALICFEDGKAYKTLRRHLAAIGMTPDGYRAKWDLPWDYPMVAASYSAARSAMAKQIGLGGMGRRKDGVIVKNTVRSTPAAAASVQAGRRVPIAKATMQPIAPSDDTPTPKGD